MQILDVSAMAYTSTVGDQSLPRAHASCTLLLNLLRQLACMWRQLPPFAAFLRHACHADSICHEQFHPEQLS